MDPFGLIRLYGVWIPGSVEAAVERMLAYEVETMRRAIGQDMAWVADQGGHHAEAMRSFMSALLRAAMTDQAVALNTEGEA
jgi:hypothetical protein